MPVQYNSKKIIPTPLVSVEKNYERTGDNHKIGSKFTIIVKGSVTCNGSPNSQGEFYTGSGYPPSTFQDDAEILTSVTQRQKFLQAKTQAIRQLFAQDGLSFEVQPWDGSAPMKCYPRVQNISFSEGIWYDKIDYTITLEADEMYGLNTNFMSDAEDAAANQDFFKDAAGNKLYLSEVSESWQLEMVDNEPENIDNPYTFRLTHNIGATGKRTYNDSGLVSEGWQQAKRWVTPRLGIDNAIFNDGTNALALSGMTGFNHMRQENTDELSGSYSVQENWIVTKENTREDFTISTQTSVETGLTTVNIEGEVIGLDTRNSSFTITQTKWDAASTKFATLIAGSPANIIFTRAQNYSGVVLNSTALGSSIGKNPLTGRITYSYQYDTRPSTCITGALSETITITDRNPTDVFAIIPVIGRALGPVLQDMGTVTERKRTVSIEVNVVPISTCPTSAAGVAAIMSSSPATSVDVVISSFEADLEANYSQVFKEEDAPSWTPRNGRYSRTVTWTFQNCS